MQYAIVNNERIEAIRGIEGKCPLCSGIVTAKCGEVRIHHWAHKSGESCDRWHERETEWHRNWKNAFPEEWREIILHDEQTGERHIADIRSNNGVVIEFQHSPINPLERKSRENFYKRMIWVIDCARVKSDYTRFEKYYPQYIEYEKSKTIGHLETKVCKEVISEHYETVDVNTSGSNWKEAVPFRQGITARELHDIVTTKEQVLVKDTRPVLKQIWVQEQILEVVPIEKCLPPNWRNPQVPVVFDFGNGEQGEFRKHLWMLLPDKEEITKITRDDFIKDFV